MRRLSALVPSFTLVATVFAGACAEGTKVDIPSIGAGGASSAASLGGRSALGGGGTTGMPKGGAVGMGGRTAPMTSGGSTSSTTALGSTGGSGAASSGGTPGVIAGGSQSDAGSGAAPTSITTVAAPVDGLGIKMADKQSVDGNNVKSSFVLVNQGTAAVDLTNIRIRYYFTMDEWTTPVLETYYAGPHIGSANVKGEFFAVALPGADRYVEISFVPSSTVAAPTLPGGSQLSIQTGLHDQSWKSPETSNDYSFTGSLVGFTDRQTVYASGTLVWGIEPGTPTEPGVGGSGGGGGSGAAGSAGHVGAGASGAAGETSGGAAGASRGGAAGASSGGAAGAATGDGVPDAGTAGSHEYAGTAGMVAL